MTQKKFCIYATTAVGTIGGIILAPAIGPLALGLPLLMGLFGKKMAEVSGLDDTDEIGYREKGKSNKFDYAALNPYFKEARSPEINDLRIRSSLTDFARAADRDNQQHLSTQVKAENKTAHGNQRSLKGARGSLRNEAYFRRHRR